MAPRAPRGDGPASSADGADAGPVVSRWPRELWDRAIETTHHRLARLCPLCPDPNGLNVVVEGRGSFNVPIAFNASGFTITVPQGARESTVVWEPCGHTVVVEGSLIPPLEGGLSMDERMNDEYQEIFTIGRSESMGVVTISGCSEQDAARITRAFQDLPGELLDNPRRLVEVLEKAALELRRDGKIDPETTIRALKSDAGDVD